MFLNNLKEKYGFWLKLDYNLEVLLVVLHSIRRQYRFKCQVIVYRICSRWLHGQTYPDAQKSVHQHEEDDRHDQDAQRSGSSGSSAD